MTYEAPIQRTATGKGILAEGLGKRFGDLWALRDLDLDIPAGSVLGLLGHNGAGKTTAVRILTTLAVPTTGSAQVAGHDVVADAAAVRASIGLAAQAATVDGLLTARAQPRAGRPPLPPPPRRRPAARRRAARAARSRRRLRPARKDVLRRHAPPARPRRHAGGVAAGAVPRRADHRPRPRKPQRPVGRCCATSSATGRRSCSRPSTSKRPTASPTTSSSSTTAARSPPAPRTR